MTVAELISDLQRQPQHLPVRVLMHEVEQTFAEGDSVTLSLSEADALPAEYARARGGFVLIAGG